MYIPDTARTASHYELKHIYDKDDNVLFGSRMVKGKVTYNYLPADKMSTGRPYIVNTSISYDGKGRLPVVLILSLTFNHKLKPPKYGNTNV